MAGPERSPRHELRKSEKNRFVCGLSDYIGHSPRLNGLQLLNVAGAQTPNLLVIGDLTFRAWKEHGGKLLREERSVLARAFKELDSKDPGKGLHIGRAFYVPGVEEPFGPRTADIKSPKDFADEVEGFYRFVVKEGYDRDGAEITLLTHPFLNTIEPPQQKDPLKPYPGGAAFMRADGVVEIHATFGQDEAVQSFPHDVYTGEKTTDGYRFTVLEHSKTHTLVPEGGEYVKKALHKKIRKDKALEVDQIAEVTKVLRRLYKDHGSAFRVEFMGTPDGLVFRECTQFSPEENVTDGLNVEGEVFILADQTREELRDKLARHKGKSTIAYANQTLFETRNFRLLDVLRSEAVANDVELVVLAYGNAGVTGHRVRNLTDENIPVVFIGEELVKDGEKIRVFSKEGRYAFEKENPVQWFSDIVAEDISRWGGKAAGLKLLTDRGFLIPQGFAVETTAFRKHLEQSNLAVEQSKLASNQHISDAEIEELLGQMQDKVRSTPLDQQTLDFTMNAFALMKESERVAIRSSASCEDQAGHSFAGRFISEIGVDGTNRQAVEKAIKEVYASVFREGVYDEASNPRVNIPFESIEMALVCHPELPGEKQGGLHTSNRAGNIVIEAGRGAGATVDIEGTRVTVVASKSKKEILSKEGSKRDFLTEKEIFLIRTLAAQAEEAFDHPQEMEWTLIDDQVVFLQTRPL